MMVPQASLAALVLVLAQAGLVAQCAGAAGPRQTAPGPLQSNSFTPAPGGLPHGGVQPQRSLLAASQVDRPLMPPPVGRGPCPGPRSEVSAAGCPCNMFHMQLAELDNGTESAKASAERHRMCPAGFRCSPSAAAAIVRAGWQQTGRGGRGGGGGTDNMTALFAGAGSLAIATADRGICVPCLMGEFCPEGTQEETWLTLSGCEMQSIFYTPAASGSVNVTRHRRKAGRRASAKAEVPRDATWNCRGVKLCPEGRFCPNATTIKPCPEGRWCPEGSIASQPCNISGLLVWNPFRTVRRSPESILEALVKSGVPLDGISCPVNSSDPLDGCPPGYFCPTAAHRDPCPIGFYCPGHNSVPVPCPVLANCQAENMSTPDWSWLGVAFMLLLLAMMLMVLEYVHMRGRSCRRAVTQEEEVMQLMEAVGFKVVGTYGSYHVSRAAGTQQEQRQGGHRVRKRLHDTASSLALGPVGRAWHRLLGRPAGARQDSAKAAPAAAKQANGVASAAAAGGRHSNNHAVVTIGSGTSVTAPVAASQQLPPVLEGSNSNGVEAPPPKQLQKQQSGAWLGKDAVSVHSKADSAKAVAPSAPGDSVFVDDEDSGEYQINPRLALLFSEVWVADRPIDGGLRRKLQQGLRGLCQRRHGGSSGSGSGGDAGAEAAGDDEKGLGSGGSSRHSKDASKAGKAAQEELYRRLDAAAAAGAYFIVPGVGGYFPHSQLHAIMGPSGCGKTTLCKALAGRLPMSHVCGDVRVLCSTAADGFQSQTELAMAGLFGASAIACNISHMTGFVPQFDLLHESLTVLENLELAGALRLPLCPSHRQGCLSGQGERRHDVKKVVGEVMALMALTKLQHKVVGTSSARILSGGQRKRVAIGVELVAKPSVLWLDEPTSGLDAAVAFDVVEALKNSSDRGMNVLAVMHQPRCSIFRLFDTCLLLGSNGHVVYAGPQRLALPYMAFLGFYIQPNENLADFLLDVIAGVIPRPGDPDYVPSQLAAMWSKAGDVWVQQQLRKEQPGNQGAQDGPNPALLLPAPPPSLAPVDWPWRPRDLEALLSRFNLLVDAGPDGRSRGSGTYHHGSTSVLSYEGFLSFWDESGLKEILGEEQFAEFIEGLCEDFGMRPDTCITQAHFVDLLKAQLRAAAAATAGVPEEQLQMMGSMLPPAASYKADAAAGTPTFGPAPTLARQSAFAAFSSNPSPFEQAQLEPQPAAGGHAQPDLAVAASAPPTALGMCDAGLPEVAAGPCAAASALACEAQAAAADARHLRQAAAAADAGDAHHLHQAAAAADAVATAACGAAVAAAADAGDPGACAAVSSAFAAAGACGEPELCSMPSRTGTPGTSLAECPTVGPGMLTCPAARMRQHALMRQMSKRHSMRTEIPTPAECQQMRQQQCQQQHMQALIKCRKARQAAMATAMQHAGQRQLSQARLMRPASSAIASEGAAAPCTSEQEARARCLSTLGNYVLAQHMQQRQEEQRNAGLQGMQSALAGPCPGYPVRGQLQGAASLPATALQARASFAMQHLPPAASAFSGGSDSHLAGSYSAPAPLPEGPAARDEAAQEAAADAVSSRKLPSVFRQLQLIILRSFWKDMLSRSAFMLDLVLTSVLGLALGVAQGRNNEPAMSLIWMLITLLAYGCMTLVRSTRSYGRERHLYLQLESPAGVSVTAWVFGHQLHDLLGLLMHPLFFFLWMYVLTLTPVPAWSYYTTLMLVGFYTSGLGYLVSLSVPPSGSTIAGLAVALILGGVANGVAPRLWQMDASHPILWLDAFSYTRWGLQALYISWLIPAPAAKAPATAAFLSGFSYCGLEGSLMAALNKQAPSGANKGGSGVNATAFSSQPWWNMSSVERSDALSAAAQDNLRMSGDQSQAAGVAAVTQLWQYFNHPELLDSQCQRAQTTSFVILAVLGVATRLLVWLLVKYKVMRKSHE